MKLSIALSLVVLLTACSGETCQTGVSYCHAVRDFDCPIFSTDCESVSYIAGDNCEITQTYSIPGQAAKIVAGTSCDVPEARSAKTCDFIQNMTYAENADGSGLKLVFEKQSEFSGFLFEGERFTGAYGEYTCKEDVIEITIGGVVAKGYLTNVKGEMTFEKEGVGYLLHFYDQAWTQPVEL